MAIEDFCRLSPICCRVEACFDRLKCEYLVGWGEEGAFLCRGVVLLPANFSAGRPGRYGEKESKSRVGFRNPTLQHYFP